MTTTTPQAIIEETARKLDVPADTVRTLFDFMDQLKAQYGDRWRTAFPGALLELVQDGVPWATDVLGAMALMIEDVLDGADHP